MEQRASRLAWSLLLATACSVQEATLIVDAPSDSLVIVAATDDLGSIIKLDQLAPSKSSLLYPAPADTKAIFTFVLAADELVHSNGEPFGPEDLSLVTARQIDSPSSNGAGCHRCPVVVFEPPQVIVDGSACAPPSWVETAAYRVKDGQLEAGASDIPTDRVRSQIVVDWPGECACEPDWPNLPPLGPPCEINPEPADLFSRHHAELNGHFAALGPNALLIAPRDAPAQRFGIEEHELGRAMGIVGTSSLTNAASFLVVSPPADTQNGDADNEVLRLRFDPSQPQGMQLSESQLVLEGPYTVNQMLDLDGREFLLSVGRLIPGPGEVRHPTILQCEDAATPRLSCDEHDVRVCDFDEGGMGDVVIFEDGSGLAVSGRGSLYLKDANSTRWDCAASPLLPDTVTFQGESMSRPNTDRYKSVSVTVHGARAFFCAELIRSDALGAYELGRGLFTASLPIGASAPEIIWYEKDGSLCASAEAQTSSNMLFSFGTGTVLEVDEGGTVVGTIRSIGGPSGRYPELPDQVDSVWSLAPDAQVAMIATSSFYRRTAGQPFERIWGPQQEDPEGAQVLAPTDDGNFVWLHPSEGAQLVEGVAQASNCSDLSVSAVEIAGLPKSGTEESVHAVTKDPRSLGELAVAGSNDRGSWIRNVDLGARAVVQEIELPFDGPVADIAILVPGVFVVIGPDGELFLSSAEGTEPLTVEYDDPSTSTREVEPARVGHRPAFSVLEAGPGVVWAGGDQRLARVLVGAPGAAPRAEGFWLEHVLSDLLRDQDYVVELEGSPHITALSAQCSDRLAVGWAEIPGLQLKASDKPYVRVLDLAPPGFGSCEGDADDLLLCEREQIRVAGTAHPVDARRVRPLGFARGGNLPILSSSSSVPFVMTLGFAETERALLLGGPHARLAVRLSSR